MIGFNYLGKMGQLGNQMFQYASLRGIAKNRGFDFCIPYHKEVFDDGIGNKLRIELFDPFMMSTVKQSNIAIIQSGNPRTEGGHNFNKTLFNTCPDNVSLYGYFQTEKYFNHIEHQIKQDFTFKPQLAIPCKHRMSTMDTPVALHIRRGDFLINSANHNNLGLDYYEEGLAKFDKDRTVIVFSDDPQWCKEQKLFDDDRFLVSVGNDSYTDLCLMSLCSDFIIANSSFSWWGAWLSKALNKVVVAPEKWFGPNNAHLDTSDMFPDEWIVIK
jgi:hypothetical protein